MDILPSARTESTENRLSVGTTKLTATRIADAAMEICESDGFEAISMRRLANSLGVTPMALYKHVPTKHELLNVIADRYLRSILKKPQASQPWDEVIYQVYLSLRKLMLKRPVLAHILISQPLDGPAAYKLVETLVSILHEAGFDGEDSVEMCRILASFTVGFTMQDLAKKHSLNSKDRLNQLSKLRHDATLHQVAKHWAKWPSNKYFDSGLRALIESYGRKRGAAS